MFTSQPAQQLTLMLINVNVNVNVNVTYLSPRKRGNMFSPALVSACVCVSVCLSVTTITKKIVGGFVQIFLETLLGGKERPTSCMFRYDR